MDDDGVGLSPLRLFAARPPQIIMSWKHVGSFLGPFLAPKIVQHPYTKDPKGDPFVRATHLHIKLGCIRGTKDQTPREMPSAGDFSPARAPENMA